MKNTAGEKTVQVPGFRFAGVSAGIKESGERDLALIYSERPAVTAGLFTTNRVKAAPVKLALRKIASRKGQAVIINSGNANACTGRQGLRDAEEINTVTAKELGISPGLVYVSSTGVIGTPLPMEKIKTALPRLVKRLSPLSLNDAASAIMTTDTFVKACSGKVRIGGKTGTIAGIAKGAGMICPHMATLLCYIFTDIAVRPGALDRALREAVNKSFNRLTVDNDMSTNDTVMIMANGLLGNKPLTTRSAYYRRFSNALNEAAYSLAKMIARDGEGATTPVEIIVKGAAKERDAEKAAMAIAGSMLVKTAIYGKDPNWGRIMAALGRSGVEIDEEKIDIYINKIKVVSRGAGTGKDKSGEGIFKDREVTVTVDLKAGREAARVLTCDLTEGYIRINAHYRT
ncbi:MAG: bifunctional glutamate N-acetyltransferase/amino-acid acetyltransferase ArgJ [Deferribacteres bacterium]|nr:bifunctional glutamate N-acetyltransferase/amino-acid acetyltransferase ArgJ [Deferribacteres bacterium]